MLTATEVHRHFEGMRAVDGVSIEVPPGRITGLIGPNGAGKSTMLAVLAGTLPATSGSIIFDGENITRLPAYARARRGLVRTFQLPSEFARLTVLENLLVAAPDNRGDSLWGALLGRRYWIGDERRIVEQARGLLRRFGMTAKESDYAGTMSGGQKRLIEIMRALMLHPRLLLLDEPSLGLARRALSQIMARIKTLVMERGLTVLLIEQNAKSALSVADEAIILHLGKVVAQGRAEQLSSEEGLRHAYLGF